ncbi:hypothetical protein CHLRE_17g724250v5 [Chlamydomonas reinhardtii]|uniref:Uncharacterized protein n=1 Tax=Chlamydomonas reinhardtii TaxID=3055 RepID=A0A2K3CQI0_CHLRE|nr:uncharacterized protein CHLRE_17g724250v5 [Chlamydomonas reinhardtii]PNW70542.1 hypothetical protein CHLRE_17g724250v5 [Chlamydomonas reinhardtii]
MPWAQRLRALGVPPGNCRRAIVTGVTAAACFAAPRPAAAASPAAERQLRLLHQVRAAGKPAKAEAAIAEAEAAKAVAEAAKAEAEAETAKAAAKVAEEKEKAEVARVQAEAEAAASRARVAKVAADKAEKATGAEQTLADNKKGNAAVAGWSALVLAACMWGYYARAAAALSKRLVGVMWQGVSSQP